MGNFSHSKALLRLFSEFSDLDRSLKRLSNLRHVFASYDSIKQWEAAGVYRSMCPWTALLCAKHTLDKFTLYEHVPNSRFIIIIIIKKRDESSMTGIVSREQWNNAGCDILKNFEPT